MSHGPRRSRAGAWQGALAALPTADELKVVRTPAGQGETKSSPSCGPRADAAAIPPLEGCRVTDRRKRGVVETDPVRPRLMLVERVTATILHDPYLKLKTLAAYAGVSVRQFREYLDEAAT